MSKNGNQQDTFVLNSFRDKNIKDRMYTYTCMIHDEFFFKSGCKLSDYMYENTDNIYY